jgi:exopolyphosphatase/guanosine-5'-triphosphate,3'-diphosphate pyrophosphatase
VKPARRAVIDIGTNSIKLLVADVDGDHVAPLWEGSEQTRLGEGFYESHRLQPKSIAATAAAVAGFAEKAREWDSIRIAAIATSAVRDAANAGELLSAIQHASGLQVEIISGDREAEWVFQGVTTDPQLGLDPLLLLDVGGGSTETILGQGRRKHFQASFPLGTVRLLEHLPHSDPPAPEQLKACRRWAREFVSTQVRPVLMPRMQWESKLHRIEDGVQLIGTGGTTTVLACMEAKLETFDRPRIEGVRLSRERMGWHTEHLWSLPLAARQQIVGLPGNRADVILTGAVICEAMMEEFKFAELRVSTRGVRFGAVLHNS